MKLLEGGFNQTLPIYSIIQKLVIKWGCANCYLKKDLLNCQKKLSNFYSNRNHRCKQRSDKIQNECAMGIPVGMCKHLQQRRLSEGKKCSTKWQLGQCYKLQNTMVNTYHYISQHIH